MVHASFDLHDVNTRQRHHTNHTLFSDFRFLKGNLNLSEALTSF